MGPKFPKNCPKTLFFQNKNEPHGILRRIRRIHLKRNIRSRTDPGFPAPGARITVVCHTNSLKLFLLQYIGALRELIRESSGSRGSSGSSGNGVRNHRSDPPFHGQEFSDDGSSQQTPSNEWYPCCEVYGTSGTVDLKI